MTRARLWLGAAAAALHFAATACDEAPRGGVPDPSAGIALADFAHSIELTPSGERAVHGVVLPEAVYRGVRSQNLSDLRVFNREGDQVPHALRALDQGRAIERGEVPLPLFPLRAAASGRAELDALSLRVERDAQGTAISVQAAPPPSAARGKAGTGPGKTAAAAPEPKTVAYILDGSKLAHPMTALRIELANAGADRVARVSVDASDDLTSFRSVAEGQALVSLEYAGQRIVRDRFDVPDLRARYLRVRAAEGEALPELRAVFAALGTGREDAEQQRTTATGSAAQGRPSVYVFDFGGFVPADSARVLLPEDNTLVQAELRSYARAGDAPQPVWSGALYRVMHAGQRLESAPLVFGRRLHRFYELRVDAKGGGLGRGLPKLELARYPDQLLFVARGHAPFQLAYGHHSVTPSGFTADEVLSVLPDAERAQLTTSDTRAAAPVTRAGAKALVEPPPPPPIKQYVLWGVLIAGVVALGVAALRMSRSLR